MIEYLVISTIALATFYILYVLLLQREKIFLFNRFYLLVAIIFSLSLPLIEIPISSDLPIDPMSSQISFESIVLPGEIEDDLLLRQDSEASANSEAFYKYLFWSIYLIGFSVLSFRFCRSLLLLFRLKATGYKIRKGNYSLVVCKRSITPFTFFNQLYVGENTLESGLDQDLINHEEVHITHRHSLDILFIELLLIIFWFQPLIYLFRKKVELNHEYTADSLVTAKASDLKGYLNKILDMQGGTLNLSLASSFSYLSIKNRIAMMTKTKTTTSGLKIKYLVVALTSVFLLTAFSLKEEPVIELPSTNSYEKTIIIDAGHGGKDPGIASGFGVEEKEVALEIAKLIKGNLDKNTSHTVILTRANDQFLTPKERVELTRTADLFISIHMEQSSFPDSHHIVYTDLGEHWHKSERLAQLTAYQFSRTSKKGVLAHQYGNYILNNAACPAVLIDLEYPTNSDDATYINSKEGRRELAEKIARAIELAAY